MLSAVFLYLRERVRCRDGRPGGLQMRRYMGAAQQAAESAVDRFKNNAFDLVVDGESYRARLKPNIQTLEPPPVAPVKKHPIHPRTRVARRRFVACEASVLVPVIRPHRPEKAWFHHPGERHHALRADEADTMPAAFPCAAL